MESKQCFKCGAIKKIDEFYKHKKMGDGYLNKCIECTKKDALDHRNKNIEKIREYDRERGKNKERMRKASIVSTRWRNRDARITSAHNKVNRALRKGVLVRKPCVICGSEKSYAHHESYNRPLDVTWYCQPHHKERHKEMCLLGIDPLSKIDDEFENY